MRRLAAEAGIDPDDVSGTGPNGRVRPADIAAGMEVNLSPVTSVFELDLTGVPNALEDRLAVVTTIAHALLHAVRRQLTSITDLVVVSSDDRILVRNAHDLTLAAIADRLRFSTSTSTSSGSASLSSAAISVIDQSVADDGVLRVPPLRESRSQSEGGNEQITVVIGPTRLRPTTRPGPVGLPTIEFRATVLLALSTRSVQSSLLVAAIKKTVSGSGTG